MVVKVKFCIEIHSANFAGHCHVRVILLCNLCVITVIISISIIDIIQFEDHHMTYKYTSSRCC